MYLYGEKDQHLQDPSSGVIRRDSACSWAPRVWDGHHSSRLCRSQQDLMLWGLKLQEEQQQWQWRRGREVFDLNRCGLRRLPGFSRVHQGCPAAAVPPPVPLSLP